MPLAGVAPTHRQKQKRGRPCSTPALLCALRLSRYGTWICWICAVSFCTTSAGSGAYFRSGASFCPSVSAQARNFLICFWYTSSHVNDEIGYASGPGASVIDTRKSGAMLPADDAAAAVTPARLAFTQLPALFCNSANGMLLLSA